MSDRQHDKLERAHRAAARGDRFRLFLADPDVGAFFAAYERDRVDDMAKADVCDDDGRRAAALRLRAMREFHSFLTSAVQAGDKASETLMKEAKSNE